MVSVDGICYASIGYITVHFCKAFFEAELYFHIYSRSLSYKSMIDFHTHKLFAYCSTISTHC